MQFYLTAKNERKLGMIYIWHCDNISTEFTLSAMIVFSIDFFTMQYRPQGGDRETRQLVDPNLKLRQSRSCFYGG
jgi:hypothetical protein